MNKLRPFKKFCYDIFKIVNFYFEIMAKIQTQGETVNKFEKYTPIFIKPLTCLFCKNSELNLKKSVNIFSNFIFLYNIFDNFLKTVI